VGLLGATALVAGGLIGSGIYLLPATMGGLGSISILGWIAAMFAALGLAGMFAWLARVVPEARGLPGFVQAGLGPAAGSATTIVYWCNTVAGNVAVSLAVAGYTAHLIRPLDTPPGRLAAAIVAIWAAVGFSWLGPRMVARVEELTLLFGLAPVVGVGVLGWAWFHPQVFVESWNPGGLGLGAAVKGSTLNAFWAFLGLEAAAAAAGVVKDPGRNVPRATLAGVLLAAAVYIAACSAIMGILPASALAKSTAPFADAAGLALGAGVGVAVAICALLRTSGCLTGWTLVGAETTRGAADEGAFPRLFRTRPGERASTVNLVTLGVAMTAFAAATTRPSLAEQFGLLTNVTVLLGLYAYMLSALSLVRLSSRLEPAHRPLALGNAVVAVLICLALIATAKWVELALSLPPLGVGFLLQLRLRRREQPA
jgi:arginine:agmatine antiporter